MTLNKATPFFIFLHTQFFVFFVLVFGGHILATNMCIGTSGKYGG